MKAGGKMTGFSITNDNIWLVIANIFKFDS
jgi:hypothetical protein